MLISIRSLVSQHEFWHVECLIDTSKYIQVMSSINTAWIYVTTNDDSSVFIVGLNLLLEMRQKSNVKNELK